MACGVLPTAFCLVVGCYRFVHPGPPVDAQQAAQETWQRLERLESFAFRLRFCTDTPFALKAEFSGVWHAPDQEAWTGYWQRQGTRQRVELRAAGANQYERTGRGWRRAGRGVETRILEQARQVVLDKKMVLSDSTRGVYRFRFEPWLPVLDPARQKKLSGLLTVDRSSGLPLGVFCSDSHASVCWELRLGRFNRPGEVAIPFPVEQELVIAPAERLSRSGLDQAVRVLRGRLGELGWDFRLVRRCGRLVLLLDRAVPAGLIELLLSSGRVELWTAVAADSPGVGMMVGGDAARRVVLGRLMAANGQYDVGLVAEPLPEPRISFVLKPGLKPENESLLVLVVDGKALDCVAGAPASFPSNGAGKATVTFAGLGNKEMAKAVAALARNETAGPGFKIQSSK